MNRRSLLKSVMSLCGLGLLGAKRTETHPPQEAVTESKFVTGWADVASLAVDSDNSRFPRFSLMKMASAAIGKIVTYRFKGDSIGFVKGYAIDGSRLSVLLEVERSAVAHLEKFWVVPSLRGTVLNDPDKVSVVYLQELVEFGVTDRPCDKTLRPFSPCSSGEPATLFAFDETSSPEKRLTDEGLKQKIHEIWQQHRQFHETGPGPLIVHSPVALFGQRPS